MNHQEQCVLEQKVSRYMCGYATVGRILQMWPIYELRTSCVIS